MPRGIDRYDEARLQGRLWTPDVWRGTSKLALWAKIGRSPIAYATGVSQVNDISGNANHLLQPTGVNQPLLTAGVWNTPNKATSALAFSSGAPHIFALTTGLTYSGGNGFSSFSAVQNNAAASTRTIHAGNFGAPQFRINSDQTAFIVRGGQLGIQQSARTVPTGFNVLGMVAASSYTAIYINGNKEEQTAIDPAFGSALSYIGMNNGSEFWDGAMGELIFSNVRLQPPDINLVNGYLAWEWGTVGNLVAGHPFKNRPPLIGD